MSRRINITITFSIEKNNSQQSIWFNGCNQHCVFLYQMLRQMPEVGRVWLAHGEPVNEYPRELMLEEFTADLAPLNDVIDQVDLLIEMALFVGEDHAKVVTRRGGKCIAYRVGNTYAITVESMLFNKHAWIPNPGKVAYSEIWFNPHYERTAQTLYEVIYRCPAKMLPHIWSSYFLEHSTNSSSRSPWGYKPNTRRSRRIGVFEPNVNVTKTSLLPLLASDVLYRRTPELIEHVYLTNTENLKDNATLAAIALGLDIVQDKKATFDPRFPLMQVLGPHAEVMLSHQWENALNYTYYEALHGGFPLVHNSPFLKHLGYYYEDFDVISAADALQRAIVEHDGQLKRYRADANGYLADIHPDSPACQEPYRERLRALFGL